MPGRCTRRQCTKRIKDAAQLLQRLSRAGERLAHTGGSRPSPSAVKAADGMPIRERHESTAQAAQFRANLWARASRRPRVGVARQRSEEQTRVDDDDESRPHQRQFPEQQKTRRLVQPPLGFAARSTRAARRRASSDVVRVDVPDADPRNAETPPNQPALSRAAAGRTGARPDRGLLPRGSHGRFFPAAALSAGSRAAAPGPRNPPSIGSFSGNAPAR